MREGELREEANAFGRGRSSSHDDPRAGCRGAGRDDDNRGDHRVPGGRPRCGRGGGHRGGRGRHADARSGLLVPGLLRRGGLRRSWPWTRFLGERVHGHGHEAARAGQQYDEPREASPFTGGDQALRRCASAWRASSNPTFLGAASATDRMDPPPKGSRRLSAAGPPRRRRARHGRIPESFAPPGVPVRLRFEGGDAAANRRSSTARARSANRATVNRNPAGMAIAPFRPRRFVDLSSRGSRFCRPAIRCSGPSRGPCGRRRRARRSGGSFGPRSCSSSCGGAARGGGRRPGLGGPPPR